MKQIHFLLFFIALIMATTATASDNISNKTLAGTWLISDVKISQNGKNKAAVLPEQSYFGDLYKAKLGLVFTETGKVDYSNYGNAQSAFYELKGNVISFYTESDTYIETPTSSEVKQKNAREVVSFMIAVNGNILTLTLVSPTITETFTFTK